jgi:hypothetical protein
MLNLRYTRIFMSEQREVVSSVVVQEEGMAMVFVKENGITKVQPSTGAAGEIFAGISLARNVPPGWMPMIEEFLVDASLSRMLLRAPLTGQILIKVGGATKTVVVGAPANNGQVGLTGQVLSFFAGEAAKSVVVQYLYEPTTVEAATFVGQAIIGGLAFQTM